MQSARGVRFRLEVEDERADGASFLTENERPLTTHPDRPNDHATRERSDLERDGRRVDGEVPGAPCWVVLFPGPGEEELRRPRVGLACKSERSSASAGRPVKRLAPGRANPSGG